MEKQYRLKKNEEIAKIVQKRIRVSGRYYILYYQPSNKIQIAFSASKKYGNAVERNHAKRTMREICRLYVQSMPCVKIVIVVKKDAKTEKFENLKKDLEKQINLICKKEKQKIEKH